MKVYRYPASPNSRKVAMVAELLGLRLEYEFVDLFAGAQGSAAYLAVNPNGLVPTLTDDDFILWESNVIMKYLADRAPAQTLWPANAREQSDIDRWMFWEQAHLAGVTFRAARETLFKSLRGGAPDPAVVTEAIENFRKLATVLDAALAGRDYISGGHLSLADIAISCQLMFSAKSGLPLGEFAHVACWFDRMRASAA